MEKQSHIFQHFQRDAKAKKQTNLLVRLAWPVVQSLVGISIISYWRQWLVLILYLCLMIIGFIFLIVTFFRDKKSGIPKD